MTETIRLAKRISELFNCSRSQAEQYIEGGWVRVNGVVVELVTHRVGPNDTIELDPKALLTPSVPMTILLNKPAGYDWQGGAKDAAALLTAQNRSKTDRTGIRQLLRHTKDQVCATPLELAATGLVIYSQDFTIKRKLITDFAFVEQEIIVDVEGQASDEQIEQLNIFPTEKNPFAMKVSLSKQTDDITGLRFAVKGVKTGQIAERCAKFGLQVVAMKRIRVGRVSLTQLEPGQWRFLMPYERF
jgi:23S rRNA pseudouridine2604 synthase